MKSTILKYGIWALIAGGILFLLSLIVDQDMDYGMRAALGYASIVLSLLFIYFGIRHFRDQENDGMVSFGKALGIGVIISVFAGLGIAIVDYIYTTSINPEFFEEYARALEEAGRGDEVFDIGSGLAAVFMFATVIVIGFIISLISALILQRK
ncbi:MAG: DUF4199 domain-containing protein [Flavobacteriaceae bacterium]|nr:DUF4199 domain-containing protein [Bacteroidia bacterium]NNF74396.1 DUF4199 domain-containing protein [Flavobacteriaceae bacterium]NNK72557.1 DUF4199 domain-containing protein [Flavobacteriaceae bacterium]